jgi:hypothetical protein
MTSAARASVRPEPVEGLSFSSIDKEERMGFDRLSLNGLWEPLT